MNSNVDCQEELVRRLPLGLAKLYRQAANAKSALDRHQAAYFLWEAALKLLGSAAIVTYAERGQHDATLAERLTNLARPALGHWWEFVRLLVPTLADAGDPGFTRVRELVLGRTRDDLPRTAGLDATLRKALEIGSGTRSTVRISELFDRLVRYRNRELGHGAAGQRPAEFYERMGRALLAGVPELLGKLDVLAGRRLVFVSDVRRNAAGDWVVDREELLGETARRLDPLVMPGTESARLPHPEHVYLETDVRGDSPAIAGSAESAGLAGPGVLPTFTALHPLVIYDPETSQMLLLNARRGRQRSEYLCYSSGRVMERQDLGSEQRELLRRVLHIDVADENVEQWAARSRAEEGPATQPESPLGRKLVCSCRMAASPPWRKAATRLGASLSGALSTASSSVA